MAKTIDCKQSIDYKLWPALEGLETMKYKPAETLKEMYDDLFLKCMDQKGYLEKPDVEPYIVLQDWAFGKLTKREALKKLDKLNYIDWEVA